MSVGTFVDSNVFLYAESPDANKRDRALALLDRLREAHTILISPQVVGEVFVNLERAFGPEAARAQTSAMRNMCVLQPLDARTTEETLRIKNRYGFDYWDAQIAAAAIASGARYLITEDLQDGQVIDGVAVVNPFAEGFDLSAL